MTEFTRDTEQNTLQGRAIRRLAVAAVLVGVAVVALSILSHRKTVPPPTPTTQTPAAPPQETMRSVEVAPPPPAPPAVAAPPVPQPAPPAGIPATPPPPPRVINGATVTEAPARVPARAKQSVPPHRQKPRATSARHPAPPKEAPRETPPSAVSETARQASSVAPPAAPPFPPLAPKGYVVQLGVFSDYHNAMDLQKRLAQHGIKSYTETRLNLGPFHSKAEAEQSMAKLRRLGISAVVVPNR